MNKLRQLSHHAVRRASSLGKLTAVADKSLAVVQSGGTSQADGIGKDPASCICGHYEYPEFA
jgi:hypothetical protein